MKNFGDPPFPEDLARQAAVELEAAGIKDKHITMKRKPYTADQYTVLAKVDGWRFTRGWYYWVCKAPEGKGLRTKEALALNKHLYSEVRIDGFAGGVPNEFLARHMGDSYGLDGRTVDTYHVDTAAGLAAFVEAIKGTPEKTREALLVKIEKFNDQLTEVCERWAGSAEISEYMVEQHDMAYYDFEDADASGALFETLYLTPYSSERTLRENRDTLLDFLVEYH